ncbi:bifunctional hydroxymethylpyrimidine kinase/phosphomethylpyrimidine kinase [Bacillus suaedaesalsae]|uniref:Hydroxymethylpyrimidine/phosphomethylpyrimidine kinase n=1 Tax=Bacillus suaedaesalsae TaxID=2810349 RepID=A0ABS2DGZ5_9BACI|nr:bifunctional hydroxymethylpyrimidine kinase/phosphomethylpyrimidine kinase [Bacillus suaedaesalsae]MBM6617754.1 bifunctional hydroxymethylpyrimidine kinase/phosphomethylpyrimidine kinase [Bacillus suaedaesalsae]
MNTKKALTIAGSDSGGGAGIQADLKTFQELGVYGMSAITAITAQNTLGVSGVHPVPTSMITSQLESIAADLTPDAVKTGMLFSSEVIQAVAHCIDTYQWKQVVIDPVMIAKGGASLLQSDAIASMKKHLLPLATLITPNIPEAEVLTGMIIQSMEDRKTAARILYELGAKHVVIKGGHNDDFMAIDLYFDGEKFEEVSSPRLQTKNTHGTGCTFSAALTAELAKGNTINDAVCIAKQFIQAAITYDLQIGSGHGPTNHWAYKQLQGEAIR